MKNIEGFLKVEKRVAEKKALKALVQYKFMMFGYWAAIWVHMNNSSEKTSPNPFGDFVRMAKAKIRDKNFSLRI